MSRLVQLVRENSRNPNAIAYAVMLIGALIFPELMFFLGGDSNDYLISLAADGGVYVLMAIGLNVVVGFAGLLDLGYAAFFAIGSYTYGMLASQQLIGSPIGHAVHVPFWIALFIGLFIAAAAGALLGAPTLRLRGDYLAIVTLGFGEIVPRIFKNPHLNAWTSSVNGISALDVPTLPAWITGPWAGVSFAVVQNFKFESFNYVAWYVLIVILIIASVFAVNNLYRSRLGRAWMAVRERTRRRPPRWASTRSRSSCWRSRSAPPSLGSRARSTARSSRSSARTNSPSSSRSPSCRWSCSVAWATSLA